MSELRTITIDSWFVPFEVVANYAWKAGYRYFITASHVTLRVSECTVLIDPVHDEYHTVVSTD
jgi:hypothetical protein